MENKLEQLENKLRNLIPTCPIKQIVVPKANKTFLCACLNDALSSIRIYDENYGLNHICSIDYRATSSTCFIESFETNENFQHLGLGRYVYNMALAHADMLGATNSYGYLEPTNTIKGVSTFNEDSREKEIEFLKSTYQNLGNKIENLNGIIPAIKFSSEWEHGERVSLLDDNQKEILNEYVSISEPDGM